MNAQESTAFAVATPDRDTFVPPTIGSTTSAAHQSLPTLDRRPNRMETELAKARAIQRRMLPSGFRQYSYMEVGGVNESCEAIGGDYFDVVELEGNRAAFVVADVSGKGLPAALLTALIQGGLVGLAHTPEPTNLISQLNSYVWARSDPDKYATAIIGEVGEDGVVDYINAGHLSGLLARQGAVNEVFHSECFPIGMFPKVDFSSSSIRLERDDTLILFSDGLTEARNTSGEEFGIERLSKSLADYSHLPAQDLSEAILSSVSGFCTDAQPTDDLTLLVLRYTGRD